MLFKKITICFLLTLLIILPTTVWAQSNSDFALKQQEVKEDELKVKVLQAYLHKFNSPLENSAQDFIDAADKYNLDWKLLPAVAGVESTFGKFIPGGLDSKNSSYNGWGWGVYGDQAIYFKSWSDAIDQVAGGLKTNYIDQGLTDPFSIGRKYSASPTWGARVNSFIKDMANFEIQYKEANPSLITTISITPVAGTSAQIRK